MDGDHDSSTETGHPAQLYAAHGVADYWAVDLPNRLLHIHRGPGQDGYATIAQQPWSTPVTALCSTALTLTLPETLTQ